MKKYMVLVSVLLLLSCGRIRSMFEKSRPLSDLYNYVNAELVRAMRLRAAGKEVEVAKIDSLLGNIGISAKTVALNMNWVLDTFDVTGDKKGELLLYIPTDREHRTGIVAIYDNKLKVLYKDMGYIRAKLVKPVYSKTGFLYYVKTVNAISRHNFVGPYLGECKLILSIQEAIQPLPLNFDAEIYSERHMRFDFYFGGQVHSEYMIQQDGEFIPLTDNLLYVVSQLPDYRKTFVFLDKLISHSYLGVITPFVIMSPDSGKFIYSKGDSIKILYVDNLQNKGLYSVAGKIVDYRWRPNSAGILIKTYDGYMAHYYTIFFEELPSYEIDMNAVFYKASTVAGSPIKYTMYPEVDKWIKDFYWEDLAKLAFVLNYNVGYPGKISAKYVVKVILDAASGVPLDAHPLSVQKTVVPLYKLTDIPWVDETRSIVEYRFSPNGRFYWKSLNSSTRGTGKYEVQGKKTIVLYYQFDIVEKAGSSGEVVQDTFNIARMEKLKVVNAPDGSIYLVTEDGVKLFPVTPDNNTE